MSFIYTTPHKTRGTYVADSIVIGNKGRQTEQNQPVTAWVTIYSVMFLLTYTVCIICGWKSRSIGMFFFAFFIALFWPLFWLYVLFQKLTNKQWKLCTETLKINLGNLTAQRK